MRRFALCALAVLIADPASAQIPPHVAVDGGVEESRLARDLDSRAAGIRALLAGELDPEIDPAALFQLPIADESRVRLEAARLRLLIEAADAERARAASRDAGAAERTAERAEATSAVWLAQLRFDRARLEFFELPASRREELLRAHAKRQAIEAPETAEAQARANAAEAERKRMLDAARAATTEAERLVREEHARLLSVLKQVAIVRGEQAAEREELAARQATAFGWKRRVENAKRGPATEADEIYVSLRGHLKASRDELDRALDALQSDDSKVPDVGPDPLQDLPTEVSLAEVRAQRRALVDQIAAARAAERTLRDDRAAALMAEVDRLNNERLGLLDYLTTAKRAAITGFTPAGLDQAHSEARQLRLIVRYHIHIAAAFLGLAGAAERPAVSWWTSASFIIPWLVLVFVFASLRRHTGPLLATIDERLGRRERIERRSEPSPLRRALQVLASVHRPVEWLLFLAITRWLMPAEALALLEVQLISVIAGWTLGTAIAVHVIDALASDLGRRHALGSAVGNLRLRSLRFVGRVFLVFVLILELSARLVGEGTIHNWVSFFFSLAAIPVFLVLVRWWRGVVFERVEQLRKKSAFHDWVLANRRGWKSFFVAMLAALQLFGLGTIKAGRLWLGRFYLARRIHAYLFRRELDRMAEQTKLENTGPLEEPAYRALGPNAEHTTWISCPADDSRAQIRAELVARDGGVVAVVGGRGSGKSSLLRQLASELTAPLAIHCTALDPEHPVETITARLDALRAAATPPRIVLLDDADILVRPVLGGLRVFDEVLAYARATSEHTFWLFAIDDVIWPFLRRMRDARPLFDRVQILPPWSEEQLAELLRSRSAQAGIEPLFDDLLERLPPTADEIDREEALAARRTAYYRMLWDYVRGNPGMALEVWRSSLVRARDQSVRVKPLVSPESRSLDALPDASLFIMRAVLQMPGATLAEVANATRLTIPQVQNAIRFGQGRGYFVTTESRVEVPWRWRRAVLLLLQRRQLLVPP